MSALTAMAPKIAPLVPMLGSSMDGEALTTNIGTGRLKLIDLDFLRGMVHWPGEPSEKQARWLDASAAALGLEVPA